MKTILTYHVDEDGNVKGHDNPLAEFDGEWQDAMDGGMELVEVAGNELDREKIAKGTKHRSSLDLL